MASNDVPPRGGTVASGVPIEDLWRYDLRRGKTDHPAHGACLYDAAKWLVYGVVGDDPPCSCPVIRAYAIGLNDQMDNEARQSLKPFILRVIGNRDPDAETARLRHIVLETARRVVPIALEAATAQAYGPQQRHKLRREAKALRDLPDDAAYGAVQKAAAAAGHCTHAAYTATAAAAAAAAARVADAAHAAYSAATAARVADAVTAWPVAVEILDEALRIGKQAPEFAEDEVAASIAAFEAARERWRDGGRRPDADERAARAE